MYSSRTWLPAGRWVVAASPSSAATIEDDGLVVAKALVRSSSGPRFLPRRVRSLLNRTVWSGAEILTWTMPLSWSVLVFESRAWSWAWTWSTRAGATPVIDRSPGWSTTRTSTKDWSDVTDAWMAASWTLPLTIETSANPV